MSSRLREECVTRHLHDLRLRRQHIFDRRGRIDSGRRPAGKRQAAAVPHSDLQIMSGPKLLMQKRKNRKVRDRAAGPFRATHKIPNCARKAWTLRFPEPSQASVILHSRRHAIQWPRSMRAGQRPSLKEVTKDPIFVRRRGPSHRNRSGNGISTYLAASWKTGCCAAWRTAVASLATRVPSKKRGFCVPHSRTALAKTKSRKLPSVSTPSSTSS
jgi:hypothetical protein